jgi:hypothetical protein
VHQCPQVVLRQLAKQLPLVPLWGAVCAAGVFSVAVACDFSLPSVREEPPLSSGELFEAHPAAKASIATAQTRKAVFMKPP